MNSVKDGSSKIKYSILIILDLSILQDLSPENFRKLKRKEYLAKKNLRRCPLCRK
jgi:hypothetical protein